MEDHNFHSKIQHVMVIEQVNSTKLKEYVDILSSFPTRNTKSIYIEKVAYWLRNFKTCAKVEYFFKIIHKMTKIKLLI